MDPTVAIDEGYGLFLSQAKHAQPDGLGSPMRQGTPAPDSVFRQYEPLAPP